MRALLFAVVVSAIGLPASAAEKEGATSLSEPPAPARNYQRPATSPPASTPSADEAIPEPEITITTKGEDRHEEYRVAGRLYMIKVIPKKGRPYYLVDREGRGEFVHSDLMPGVSPPLWVIKRF